MKNKRREIVNPHFCIIGKVYSDYNNEEMQYNESDIIKIENNQIFQSYKYCPICGKKNKCVVIMSEKQFNNGVKYEYKR